MSSTFAGATSSSRSDKVDGGEHRYYEVGIEHIAFYVDAREDVDAAYRRCLDIGARIHFPPEEDRGMPGYYEMFVFDPDGMRVEVAYSPAVTVGGGVDGPAP